MVFPWVWWGFFIRYSDLWSEKNRSYMREKTITNLTRIVLYYVAVILTFRAI